MGTKLLAVTVVLMVAATSWGAEPMPSKEVGQVASKRPLSGSWAQRLKQRFRGQVLTTQLPDGSGQRQDYYRYDKATGQLVLRGSAVKGTLPDGNIIAGYRVRQIVRPNGAEARKLIERLSDIYNSEPADSRVSDLGRGLHGRTGRVVRKVARGLGDAIGAAKAVGAGAKLALRALQAAMKLDGSVTIVASPDGKTKVTTVKLRLADGPAEAKVIERAGRAPVIQASTPELEDLLGGHKYYDVLGVYDAVRDALARRAAGKQPTRTQQRVVQKQLDELQALFARAEKHPGQGKLPTGLDAENLIQASAAMGKHLTDAAKKTLLAAPVRYHLEAALRTVDKLQAKPGGEWRGVAHELSSQLISAARRGLELPRPLLQQVAEAQTWFAAQESKARRSTAVEAEQTLRRGPGERRYLHPRELLQELAPERAAELVDSKQTASWAKEWKLSDEQWQQELAKGVVRSFGQAIQEQLGVVHAVLSERNPYRIGQAQTALASVERLVAQTRTRGIQFDGNNATHQYLRESLAKLDGDRAALQQLAAR